MKPSTCPECGAEKANDFGLAIHRRVMHPVEWKAGNDALRDELSKALLRKIEVQSQPQNPE